MIRNYFKIAWRNLNKHRLFSMINILGLAIGVASFWIIALYITDEWSFDRYHEKADRIFRVAQRNQWDNNDIHLAQTSLPYAQALKADYPEVEEAVRLDFEGGGKIAYDEKQFMAADLVVADKGFFDVFTYHFLSGDPVAALARPQSIVLTRSLAVKIFGDIAGALGKTIVLDGRVSNLVTAVIEDVPANSQFSFSGVRSFDDNYTGPWADASIYTYVLLKEPGDYKKIEARSGDFYNKYLKNGMVNVRYDMELQPLTSIHLHSHLYYDYNGNGNIFYIYIFGLAALLILGIAMINYVNLTTARSSVRIKEIGIRKVIGSGRRQLMLMFFSESILLACIATALALVLVDMALPFFNEVAGKTMYLWQFGKLRSLLVFGGFALLAGLISGIYPALFLSGFRTIPAMKGQLGNQSSTIVFRKSLVTFQFVITVIMIFSSCIIYQQLHFVMNTDLGFNKSQILSYHIQNRGVRTQIAAVKTELLRNPLIENVAVAGNPIGNNDIGSTDFNLGPDGKAAPDTKMVESLIIDEDFIPAMQIKILQGRNFTKGPADSADGAILVNAALVRELGWQNPVGRRVRTGFSGQAGGTGYSTIVGVVKDFNTYSLQHQISPMVMRLPPNDNEKDNLYVRLSGKNIPTALAYLQQVYGHFDKENKVDYHFLDQNFASQYRSEERQGKLLLIFTVLAICIACLGLFGLVTFTAEQRVKEIGIRKVLGAGVYSIVKLLTGELIGLVLVATVIATPLGWYGMHKWLQGFAYRTDIHGWVFLLAGSIALGIAFMTIAVRSVKAAMANPAESLKSE
ncbi:MAG: ABC transporter permease [Puia sp.]|nr:ABC transporter permease [Puia sp.]